MKKNYPQSGVTGFDGRIQIDNDWFNIGLPANVALGENVFIDTSYGFTQFNSTRQEALVLGESTGCYDRSTIITAEGGSVTVGKYVILNGTTLVCKDQITIGDHCMLAWGSVITDSWLDPGSLPVAVRRAILEKTARDPQRRYPFFGDARPVVLEDNCWVGFDAVIMPGVRLGRGCVVGCKSIIDTDVPPYAVVTGSPARIVKFLDKTDRK